MKFSNLQKAKKTNSIGDPLKKLHLEPTFFKYFCYNILLFYKFMSVATQGMMPMCIFLICRRE